MPTQRSHHNDAFLSLLSSLNPAQGRAVERIEGPVLVIAGPGTGKTHVLAARIGKILLDTDARAQNILCLTFTDSGAVAMRRRLLAMIGPEAHRVPIFTFHSFCNRIIQENLELFAQAPQLEPISELERIGLVRDLLAELPPEHPLREGRKDAFPFERHLRDLFSTMKKEGWTPGFVQKKIKEYLDNLPQNPDFQYKSNTKHGRKGEPKTAQIKLARERMERLAAGADLFPKYLRAMERAGRYEYEDMLLWVLKAFEKNEALLRNYQERYQYFLVDEYQDTNGAQNRLLQLLIDYWESPNIFIVGDDDQSIYEFQGARLKNLLDFYRAYRTELELVVLEENYRSTQDILDAAARVIRHNALRAINALDAPISKDLRAMIAPPPAPPSERRGAASPLLLGGRAGGGVLLRSYPNALHETTGILQEIEILLLEGESPANIAVLYARHRQALPLMALLEKKRLPYQTKRPVNILELPLVQHLRELLQYLQDERERPFSGEGRLFRLLHAAFFELAPLDLAKLGFRLYKGGFWREALSDPEFLYSLNLLKPEQFIRLGAQFEAWIGDVYNLPLPALIENIYNRSGLLAYALAQPDRIWQVQVLNSFLDFVKAETERAFSPLSRKGRGGVAHLLTLLQSMDDNRLALPLDQSVRTGEAIQLLTAHSAKGLEFRHVFLLGCSAEEWEPGPRAQSGRFSLPPTLTLSGEEDALEARRRLFYVAMTRAKSMLSMSWHRAGADGKALTQARFVDETALPVEERSASPEAIFDTQILLLLEPEAPVITLPEPALLDEMLDQFTLSISSLNRYLRCPLAFYYEDLLRVPEVISESAAFGEAMHGALQQFFLKKKSREALMFPSADTLLRLFTKEMEKRRGYFAESAWQQRLALGRNFLQRYRAEQVPMWRHRAVVERRVERVELAGIPLTGVIDKVEWLEGGATLRIVDYKSGVPDLKRAAPPDEAQPQGGDFWRQLLFYKILLDRSRYYPETVVQAAAAWLEPDRRGIFPTVELGFEKAEVQFLENLITEVYQKIQAREFNVGCGREDCEWCTMHRLREAPAAGFGRPEEGLDDGS